MFVISNIQTLLVKPSGMKDRNENFAIAHRDLSAFIFKEAELVTHIC